MATTDPTINGKTFAEASAGITDRDQLAALARTYQGSGSSGGTTSTAPTHYNQTTNTTPTYGEENPSVLAFQQSLNAKNKGVAGYTPIAEDSKYGPLTQAAANFQAPAPGPLPRVTPTGITPTAPTPQVTPADPMAGEDAAYKELLDKSSGLIDSTKSTYDRELQQQRAGTAGVLASAGLGGSTAAYTAESAAEQPILQAREADLQTIYNNIRTTAHEYSKENYTKAQDSVKAMAANHLDWNAYKTTNPDNYKALVTSLGGDPNYADALFASSIPPANIIQSWTQGSTQFQLTQDPLTGKPSIQSYDLGVKIPQNWTADKVGTNSVIYHGPNWDPTDPSTYQMFAVDPLTGIPTTQVGGSYNSSMGDAVVSNIVSNLSAKGITVDPTAPIDVNSIPDIAQAIIEHEHSQIDPSFNNPGDVKFAGLPGQTDTGVKASDGGTWASYATKTDGEKAVQDLVTKAAQKGTPFGTFIKSYTGTATSSTADQQAVQNWVNNIQNGNATLTNVPAAARTAVSNALANSSTGSYTPLADARFTTAANRIVSNFIQMPAYQLTAGGQLYLGRINAALKTPGSVSDQDLLDSLTKLNTGGNAISDAQVKLITDGKSYSDWANTISNKFKNGGVLSDSQRQQIQTLAQNIFKSYQTAYQPIYEQATKQLQDAGIPKAFWTIPDLNTLTAQSAGATDGAKVDLTQYKAIPFSVPSGYDYNYDRDNQQATLAIKTGADATSVWGHFNTLSA